MAFPGFFREMLLGYARFQDASSLFPTGSSLLEKSAKELKPCFTHKGAIRFPADKPVPDARPEK
jgi:uncharacterized protein YdhG (YjbR/CyaY superfamily)